MAGVSAISPTDWSTFGLAPAAQQSAIAGQVSQSNLENQQAAGAQQSAIAAAMQNQILQARMPVIIKALQSYGENMGGGGQSTTPGGIPETGGTPGGVTPQDISTPQGGTAAPTGTPTDASAGSQEDPSLAGLWDNGKISAQLRRQLFINSAGTPQEVQGIIQAAMSGDPGILAAAKETRDSNVKERTAQSNYDSGNIFDAYNSVIDADPGQALNTLAGVASQMAARIKTKVHDPELQDAAARQYATTVAGQAHIYTGREVEEDKTDGTYRDKITGQIVPGAQASGMTADQWYQKAQFENEKVETKQTDGSTIIQHRYQQEGYPDLRTAVMKQAQGAGIIGAQPNYPNSAPAQHAQKIINSVAKASPPTPPTVTPPPAPPAPPGAAQSIPTGPMSHMLAQALADPSWRDTRVAGTGANAAGTGPAPVTTGGQAPGNLEQQKEYLGERSEAAKALNDQATTTRAAIYNFAAARQILSAQDGSSIRMMTGLPGAILNEASKLGFDTDTAAHRQEAAKYFINAAISGLKDTYGARPGVFDVKINTEKAFPNIDGSMGRQAMIGLTNSNLKRSVYLQTMASYGSQYLRAGNRPLDLGNWQNKNFPMAESLLGPGASSTAKPTPKGGATFTAAQARAEIARRAALKSAPTAQAQ